MYYHHKSLLYLILLSRLILYDACCYLMTSSISNLVDLWNTKYMIMTTVIAEICSEGIWMWPSCCVFLTIYFTYNSVNTTIKYYRFVYSYIFWLYESSSGYDWNPMCSQGTRAHFGIPKRLTHLLQKRLSNCIQL